MLHQPFHMLELYNSQFYMGNMLPVVVYVAYISKRISEIV